MLRIIITGEACSGKTSAAAYIAEALRGLGLKVTVDDEEFNMDPVNIKSNAVRNLMVLAKRDNGVHIETRQLRSMSESFEEGRR